MFVAVLTPQQLLSHCRDLGDPPSTSFPVDTVGGGKSGDQVKRVSLDTTRKGEGRRESPVLSP